MNVTGNNVYQETTDLAIFVRTSSEDFSGWDRQKIVDALVRETYVDVDTADSISKEVQEQIAASRISVITTPLIVYLEEPYRNRLGPSTFTSASIPCLWI